MEKPNNATELINTFKVLNSLFLRNTTVYNTCMIKKLPKPRRKKVLPEKSKNTSPSHANIRATMKRLRTLDLGVVEIK